MNFLFSEMFFLSFFVFTTRYSINKHNIFLCLPYTKYWQISQIQQRTEKHRPLRTTKEIQGLTNHEFYNKCHSSWKYGLQWKFIIGNHKPTLGLWKKLIWRNEMLTETWKTRKSARYVEASKKFGGLIRSFEGLKFV